MTIRKIKYLTVVIVVLIVMFIIYWFGRKGEKDMIIKVEGFEVEYSVTDKEITIEDFNEIELGSSIYEIRDKLGEPDAWIGSGMLRPVYFLENNKVVVLHFLYPAACENLRQVVLVNENGESQIIKER